MGGINNWKLERLLSNFHRTHDHLAYTSIFTNSILPCSFNINANFIIVVVVVVVVIVIIFFFFLFLVFYYTFVKENVISTTTKNKKTLIKTAILTNASDFGNLMFFKEEWMNEWVKGCMDRRMMTRGIQRRVGACAAVWWTGSLRQKH